MIVYAKKFLYITNIILNYTDLRKNADSYIKITSLVICIMLVLLKKNVSKMAV